MGSTPAPHAMKTDPILKAWTAIGQSFAEALETELKALFADVPSQQASDEELVAWAKANDIVVVERKPEGTIIRHVDATRGGQVYVTLMLHVISDDHGVKLSVSVRRYAPC